jgi:hypothetical protein
MPQNKLDLPVQTPQIVIGPLPERIQHLPVDSQKE